MADGGGIMNFAVDLIALRDGLTFRETRYYADPFEPPDQRSLLVERFTP